MTTTDEPAAALKRFGQLEDHSLPLADVALVMASFDHPGVDLGPYRMHLAELADEAAARLGTVRQPDAVAAILADVIATKNGYFGDSTTYDDLQNADIIRVIDRRRGLPVALGILYLETAARLGVAANGLNAPGHFVIGIGQGDAAVVIDPFNGGVALGLMTDGPGTSAGQPILSRMGKREVLLRLANNARSRNTDPARILTLTERMILLAPRRADIWFELAQANEVVGKLRNAIRALESCIAIAGAQSSTGRDASLALGTLKRKLN